MCFRVKKSNMNIEYNTRKNYISIILLLLEQTLDIFFSSLRNYAQNLCC